MSRIAIVLTLAISGWLAADRAVAGVMNSHATHQAKINAAIGTVRGM